MIFEHTENKDKFVPTATMCKRSRDLKRFRAARGALLGSGPGRLRKFRRLAPVSGIGATPEERARPSASDG